MTVLAKGHLSDGVSGHRFGAVAFPPHVEYPAHLDLVTRDHDGIWCARLRIGRDETQVRCVPAVPLIDQCTGMVWVGAITVDGYPYDVRINHATWLMLLRERGN